MQGFKKIMNYELLHFIMFDELPHKYHIFLNIMIYKTTGKLGTFARKPVFGVSDRARLKPACSATGTS